MASDEIYDNTINSVQNMNLTTERYIVTRWQSLYTFISAQKGDVHWPPDHQFEKEQQ